MKSVIPQMKLTTLEFLKTAYIDIVAEATKQETSTVALHVEKLIRDIHVECKHPPVSVHPPEYWIARTLLDGMWDVLVYGNWATKL